MRWTLITSISLILIALPGLASAQPWQSTDPVSAGWSVNDLRVAQNYATSMKTTAVMVVQDGKVIASWGDVSRKVNPPPSVKACSAPFMASQFRKAALISVERWPNSTSTKRPTLSMAEKQATVRDLLMARSGVYHAAAYETADIRQKRPARGRHAPGLLVSTQN